MTNSSSVKPIRIGIDATNIKRGGGVTHLMHLLNYFNPDRHGIDRIILWGVEPLLSIIDNQPWLVKINLSKINTSLAYRIYWHFYKIKKEAKIHKCNLLFFPGGLFFTNFKPVVTMSRNMLPFAWVELKRFGLSITTFRYLFLFIFQSISFKRANGLIFLTNYTKSKISSLLHINKKTFNVIPHGVNTHLFKAPRIQLHSSNYSSASPFRFIYISIINKYKHQYNVISAIDKLRKKRIPITLDLIGPAYAPALKQLKNKLSLIDPKSNFIKYHGEKPFKELKEVYHNADGFIFASSCENMPNILLEAMASGLPIASSNRGPMPEILKDGGVYFNPEDINSIKKALYQLFISNKLRERISNLAFAYSREFSWEKCADSTFSTLLNLIKDKNETNTSII